MFPEQIRDPTIKEDASSSSGSISTAAIERIVESLRMEKLRKSTRTNYYQIWKNFNQFIIKLDKKPANSEDRLTLYIGYLIDKNRKSTTIKSYISAIKSVLKDNEILIHEDTYLLSSLTRACRLRNDRVKTRLPIGKDVLHVILQKIEDHFLEEGQMYLKLLYTTMICTAFYGMFRIGELASGSHPVLIDDVFVGTNKRKFLFVLRSSKTHDRSSKPQEVKIKVNNKRNPRSDRIRVMRNQKWCPFKLLGSYSKTRPKSKSSTEPFFVHLDRSPVKPSQLREVLRMALKMGGFNPCLYGFHSLRAGRSVYLVKKGVPVEIIKRLGRWKSNVIFTYLKN